MTDKYQMVLGALAVAVLVLVPVLCVIGYDVVAGRWDESLKLWRARRQLAREHKRDLRALRQQKGLPLEQVVADLRRLRLVVGKDAARSAAQQMGNRLAYDRLLVQACQMLEIEHELGRESVGLDRDIERVRVEAELERVGVQISDRRFGQAA
jgi:hypothetical protein